MAEFDLTDRATYRHWSPVTIRFSDQDSLAHINNVALAQYFEVARTAYVYDVIRAAGPEAVKTVEFILARVVIDFVRELHYPGRVEVGCPADPAGQQIDDVWICHLQRRRLHRDIGSRERVLFDGTPGLDGSARRGPIDPFARIGGA